MKRYRMVIRWSRINETPEIKCIEANLGKWVRSEDVDAEMPEYAQWMESLSGDRPSYSELESRVRALEAELKEDNENYLDYRDDHEAGAKKQEERIFILEDALKTALSYVRFCYARTPLESTGKDLHKIGSALESSK